MVDIASALSAINLFKKLEPALNKLKELIASGAPKQALDAQKAIIAQIIADGKKDIGAEKTAIQAVVDQFKAVLNA